MNASILGIQALDSTGIQAMLSMAMKGFPLELTASEA